uniref:Thyrotropin receptor n=1 Tax=Petromyzon marinus TaxID=7757 RepID=Q0P6K8_PETMA|nr:testicular glycoprotein hormone receptor I precursor [Petromyzon marinus]
MGWEHRRTSWGALVALWLQVLALPPKVQGGACSPGCVCAHDWMNLVQCVGGKTLELSLLPAHTQHLVLMNTVIERVPSGAFSRLRNVTKIDILVSRHLRSLEAMSFSRLSQLQDIEIRNANRLAYIHRDAFHELPSLRFLGIANTAIECFPHVGKIQSTVLSFILEILDNPMIDLIPANALQGLSSGSLIVRLFNNKFAKIEDFAFNATMLDLLDLHNNDRLWAIGEDAFSGIQENSFILDVSRTSVRSLPRHGLQHVWKLMANAAWHLKQLPPMGSFSSLCSANLTYPSHCCVFWHRKAAQGCHADIYMDQELQNESFASSDFDLVQCAPEPDAFNPCEDLMGHQLLRLSVWFVSVLAVLGNSIVILVILSSRYKLAVPRFLMCNLAFADLCMGVYLLTIASFDVYTRGEYHNHAIDWQTGLGCRLAGFLTVFSSELSVFTLTVITVERWHTIIYTMRLDRKVSSAQAVTIMASPWALALVLAALPLAGISSYSKVSICLPMDIETLPSQAYVQLILGLNILAFLVICVCYAHIYSTVRNPSYNLGSHDAKIAKRMAVLIFTDFTCMAPISFFAILAAAKLPLITVSHTKILLVLFYPLNACANPLLYAIFTKSFRRDVFILLSRVGLCERRAQRHRGQVVSGGHPGLHNGSVTVIIRGGGGGSQDLNGGGGASGGGGGGGGGDGGCGGSGGGLGVKMAGVGAVASGWLRAPRGLSWS